jgi:transcriptional regulator with XRE-family HTH domain
MTQEELGTMAGVKRAAIANIEAGRRTTLHTLYNICIALHVEPSEVLPTVAETTTAPTFVSITLDGKTKVVDLISAKLIRNIMK